MSLPENILQKMRDDAKVLAIVSAIEEAPLTEAIISSVGEWFNDVEIVYPIAQMHFEEKERRDIINTIAIELTERFEASRAAAQSNSGALSEEQYEQLGKNVDPLWRELTGLFAKELNYHFEKNRIPQDEAEEYLQALTSSLSDHIGEQAKEAFLSKIKTDKNLRAHLRRIGIDPDSVQ